MRHLRSLWEQDPGASGFFFTWLQIVRSGAENITAIAENIERTGGSGEFGYTLSAPPVYMQSGDYARIAVQHNSGTSKDIDSIQSSFGGWRVGT